MEKSCRKYAPKASPRALFNFGRKHNLAIACKNSFEKGLSKSL